MEPNKETTPIEVIDTLCRDVVKNLNKTIFEQRAKIEWLTDSYKELLANNSKEQTSSPDQAQLFEALIRAKGELGVDFEKTGAGFKSKGSATYSDLVYVAKPILVKHGIDIIHEPIERGKEDLLKTTITHISGQWRSSICAIRPDHTKNIDPNQAYGSALTYMKKYVYAAILNLHPGGDNV